MKQIFWGSILIIMTAGFLVSFAELTARAADEPPWTDAEVGVLRSLWIGSLPPLPKDPSNAFSDNPEAVALGKKFFFDSRFSGNLKVSCATCHRQDMSFSDDLPVAHGMGTSHRRTMPLIGATYGVWFFWDGRKDSLWSQALAPIENPLEHGFTRTQCVAVIYRYYRKEYEKTFGPMPAFTKREIPPLAKPSIEEPEALKEWVSISREKRTEVNRIYANMGKAIAAFVRTILPEKSRFDKYVEAVIADDRDGMSKMLSADEVRGLRLFIGKAKCINCHNGPLFTNGEFHNIHVPQPPGFPVDRGRADAIPKVLVDEFNCLSVYSDAGLGDCAELRFMDTDTAKSAGAFKTPSLRNVAKRPPYMHAGQFSSIRKVLEFYRNLKPEERPPELQHGDFGEKELNELEAFLGSLNSSLTFAQDEATTPKRP
jgi:cytochrome c peroxidase